MEISSNFLQSRRAKGPEDLADLRSFNGKLVRFGRAWWFWMPRLRWNKGLPWRDVWSTIGIQWLCFSWSVDFVR